MATDKQQVDVQSRWKNRYYEVLGELESREKSWREAERLLRQLVTRLTLAADSRHVALNNNLQELRNAVRDGRDFLKLQELINQISEQITELDQIRKSQKREKHPSIIFTEILDKLDIPDDLSREYKQLKKDIKKLDKNDDANEVAAEFINIIQRLLHDDEETQAPTTKQKLIDRILSRQSTDEKSDKTNAKESENTQDIPQRFIAPAVGELLLQLALRMPDRVKTRINFGTLKRHTSRARRRKDLIPIIDVIAQQIEEAYQPDHDQSVEIQVDSIQAISNALKQFLLEMEPPVDLKQRVADIELFYSERENDVDSLVHCLNALAEIVAEICNRLIFQHDEFENFFEQLSTRLQDLDSGIKKTSSYSNESLQNGAKMGKSVREEVKGIKSSIDSSEDIEKLKSDIQSRINAIDEHIQGFHGTEKQRFENAQVVISELSKKVGILEENSVELRNKLEESQQQALRDVLTGIPNRQAYEERLAAEIARCKRYGSALSMVVWDIDKFKDINDNYGHAAGDRVLKVIAELLSERIRETDFIARHGGEEFVTLMPETDLDTAIKVADKLRIDIEQTAFHFRDKRVPVTISAGVGQYQNNEMVADLFERTDAAMYKAKQAGNNQVKSTEE